jgi:uncharacterized delta-60 repeat protein
MKIFPNIRQAGLAVSLALVLIHAAPAASQTQPVGAASANAGRQFWVPDFAYGQAGAVRMPTFTWPRTREDLNVDHVALQPSGKMLVFEGLSPRFDQNHGVARLNADGSVDVNFGANGFVSMPQADGDTDCIFRNKAYAMYLDGSFLLRDSTDGTLRTLARFTVDGRRDASFVPELPLSAEDKVVGLLADPAGGALVATLARNCLQAQPVTLRLWRLLSNGRLNAAFGVGGRLDLPVSSLASALFQPRRVLPDGRIIGYVLNGSTQTYKRLLANGAVDPGYGVNGELALSIDESRPVEVAADGRILHQKPGTRQVDVYSADGARQRQFMLPDQIAAGDMIATNDDRVIVTGRKSEADPWQMARINTNGALDTSFGTRGDGIVTLTPDAGEFYRSFFVLADDSIVQVFFGGSAIENAIHRFTRNGGSFGSFGTNGRARFVVVEQFELSAGGVIGLLNDDGSMLSYKQSFIPNLIPGEIAPFSVVRIGITGTIDSAFGRNGVVTVPAKTQYGTPAQILARPDGAWAFLQGDTPRSSNYELRGFTSTGQPDLSFGVAGVVNVPVSSDVSNSGRGVVAAAAVGKLYIADTTSLARYNADGAFDAAFAANGVLRFSVAADALKVYVSDGFIYLMRQTGDKIDLYRFTLTGAEDLAFGVNGRKTIITWTPIVGGVSNGARGTVAGPTPDGGLWVLLQQYICNRGCATQSTLVYRVSLTGTLQSAGLETSPVLDVVNALSDGGALLVRPSSSMPLNRDVLAISSEVRLDTQQNAASLAQALSHPLVYRGYAVPDPDFKTCGGRTDPPTVCITADGVMRRFVRRELTAVPIAMPVMSR